MFTTCWKWFFPNSDFKIKLIDTFSKGSYMRMFLFFLGVNWFYYEIYVHVLAFRRCLYLDVRLETVD